MCILRVPTAGELHDKAGHTHIYALDEGWPKLLTMSHLNDIFYTPIFFHLQYIFIDVYISSHI
jgi:hypothetical protein